jgi:hypothetical protein
LAAKYNFDLRGCLGSVLKSKFDFTSFDGIAEAYLKAFGECKELQELGKDLKRLEQVRHLIVHRGGLVDEKFVYLTKMKVRPDTVLFIRVEEVRDYMLATTLGSLALLRTVDNWFVSQCAKRNTTLERKRGQLNQTRSARNT